MFVLFFRLKSMFRESEKIILFFGGSTVFRIAMDSEVNIKQISEILNMSDVC